MAASDIVLIASAVESNISVWDLNLGTELGSFKTSSSGRGGLTLVGDDHFAASQLQKGGAIFSWTWQKNGIEHKSYPVEQITPLASSPDGNLIAGGGASGRLYLWEVSTGKLLRSWPGHYKTVTCLTFSDDGSLLFSGGEDGIVSVWPLVKVLSGADLSGDASQRPLYSWSEHTLPVTGLWTGAGGASAVLLSSSLDHTVKIWSVALGSLLRSVVFPTALYSITADSAEYFLYAGGSDGRIFALSLQGSGSFDDETGADGVLMGHSLAVTSLAVSSDGATLVSGSEDGTARAWDVNGRQQLRTLQHGKGPVTNVLVLLKPPNLFSADNRKRPLHPFAALRKYPGADQTTPGDSPWEGPLVILPGSEPRPEAGSYGTRALARLAASMQQNQALVTAHEERSRLLSQVEESNRKAAEWQALHKELYMFAVNDLIDKKDKEPGVG